MTFKEFRQSTQFTEINSWFIVTTTGAADPSATEVHVLQWEPSNGKWYAPEPVWGRVEFGYLDTVGQNSRVVNIRALNT